MKIKSIKTVSILEVETEEGIYCQLPDGMIYRRTKEEKFMIPVSGGLKERIERLINAEREPLPPVPFATREKHLGTGEEFEYSLKIKSVFTPLEWREMSRGFGRIESVLTNGVINAIACGSDVYLTFREIDQMAKYFEMGQNPILFKKCVDMCNAINERYKQLRGIK